MEVWYDPATMEVKAVYSDRYTGRVWTDAGWVTFQNDTRRVPRDLGQGAIADFTGPEPIVITPTPIIPPPVTDLRLQELYMKLAGDNITDAEIRELLRLERNL